MSTRCPACYQNTFPEVPSITLIENTYYWDGAQIAWYNEYFTTASTGYNSTSKILTLAKYPVNPESVQLSLNGVVQGENSTGDLQNFSVSGNLVSLNFTPAATDAIHIHYPGFVTSSEDEGEDEPVGTMRAYAGTTAPPGWLFLDGTTSNAIASFPALYTHASANSLILSETATHFVLKEIKTQMTVGGVATSVNTIIKT